MITFDIGETVICSCEVKDSAGALKDPTTMAIIINRKSPIFANVQASTTMIKDSTGKYHYDFQTPAMSLGDYEVVYKATDGTRISIEKDNFKMEG